MLTSEQLEYLNGLDCPFELHVIDAECGVNVFDPLPPLTFSQRGIPGKLRRLLWTACFRAAMWLGGFEEGGQ